MTGGCFFFECRGHADARRAIKKGRTLEGAIVADRHGAHEVGKAKDRGGRGFFLGFSAADRARGHVADCGVFVPRLFRKRHTASNVGRATGGTPRDPHISVARATAFLV